MTLYEFFSLMGGVGLFLYCMTIMSTGLRNTCVERLKTILEYATKNKIVSVLSGIAVTMLIQSSSATDVMVIGFVNSGLMNLTQVIRVIMLTVISKDQTAADGKAKWICQCECGNITSVLSESLRNGSTKSCGCIVSRLKHNLTGMVYGHLLVLERTYDRRYVSKDTRWKCLCQNCGRKVSVTSYKLRTSNPYGHCKCTRYKK